jgi:hypothetical protein
MMINIGEPWVDGLLRVLGAVLAKTQPDCELAEPVRICATRPPMAMAVLEILVQIRAVGAVLKVQQMSLAFHQFNAQFICDATFKRTLALTTDHPELLPTVSWLALGLGAQVVTAMARGLKPSGAMTAGTSGVWVALTL